MTDRNYYVYMLKDADGVPRYFGKGTGRRAYSHQRKILKLIKSIPDERTWLVHNRFAADGRPHEVVIIKDGLTQAAAYKREVRMIAKYGREIMGEGPLWNVLPGDKGFKGIERDVWRPIAQRVADNKKLTGADKRAADLAAKTKASTGADKRAGEKAALKRRMIKALYTSSNNDAGLFTSDQLMGQMEYERTHRAQQRASGRGT